MEAAGDRPVRRGLPSCDHLRYLPGIARPIITTGSGSWPGAHSGPRRDVAWLKGLAMSRPTIEQTKMGTEAIAFCIARTLIERDPSLKAPMRANLRKMWELLEEREDHAAADMVDTLIKALNDPAFFKP
jgi:hypothetical protein